MKLYFSENYHIEYKSKEFKKLIKGCNKIVKQNKKIENLRKSQGLLPLDRSVKY